MQRHESQFPQSNEIYSFGKILERNSLGPVIVALRSLLAIASVGFVSVVAAVDIEISGARLPVVWFPTRNRSWRDAPRRLDGYPLGRDGDGHGQVLQRVDRCRTSYCHSTRGRVGIVDLERSSGAELASGRPTIELTQLPGRSRVRTMMAVHDGVMDPITERAFAEWIVHGPAGATVRVVARHQRAGVARAEVALG